MKLSFSQKDDSEFSYDAKDGYYEGYRDQNLPDGYTAYRKSFDRNPEGEYDRYEYDHAESPSDNRPERYSCERLKACCCDMGRLIELGSYHKM